MTYLSDDRDSQIEWTVSVLEDNLRCVGTAIACYLWDYNADFSFLPTEKQKNEKFLTNVFVVRDSDSYELRIQLLPNKIGDAFKLDPKSLTAIAVASHILSHEIIHVIQTRDGTKANAHLNYNNPDDALYSLEIRAEMNALLDNVYRAVRTGQTTNIAPYIQESLLDIKAEKQRLEPSAGEQALLTATSIVMNRFHEKFQPTIKWYEGIGEHPYKAAEELPWILNKLPREENSHDPKFIEEGEMIVSSRDILARLFSRMDINDFPPQDHLALQELKLQASIYNQYRDTCDQQTAYDLTQQHRNGERLFDVQR